MTNLLRVLLPLAGAAAASFFAIQPARAGLEACGNIDVRAEATCKVETSGGCTAQCEPVRVEAACAGKLYAECNGQCNVAVDAQCTASCTGGCLTKCSADPPKLDCRADCQGTCAADCSGKCGTSENKAECEASCKATCSGKCDGTCTGTPPSATCEAKCQASCTGSCQARANVDCQVSCQSRGYVSCKTTMTGGCKARCEKPEGALFCDGNYVDTGNNLQSCIDALKAALNVKVEASGSSSCTGNECNADGTAKVTSSCAVASATGAPLSPGLFFGFAGAIAVGAVRRRRRAPS